MLGSAASIAESKRIEFYPGKRKLKNGETKKTGNYYWEYRWKTDTGERKAKYGGRIETVPARYWQRAERYKAAVGSGSPESLADGLFRPAIIRVQSGDTGTG